MRTWSQTYVFQYVLEIKLLFSSVEKYNTENETRQAQFLLFSLRNAIFTQDKSSDKSPHCCPSCNQIDSKSDHNCVSEGSWRRLGSSWGALGVPLGGQGGSNTGFSWILAPHLAPIFDDFLINKYCFFGHVFQTRFSWFWDRIWRILW